jgi:hypothetical protein
MAIFTIVTHLNLMLFTFLFSSFTSVNDIKHLSDVSNESFTFSKVSKGHHFPAMWTLCFLFLDPGAKALFAGHLAARRTHFRLLQRLVANIAVEEGHVAHTGHHFLLIITSTVMKMSLNFTSSHVNIIK